MGWSEVVGEVSMDELIGRLHGDGGRFRRPWLFRKVDVGVRSNFFVCHLKRGTYVMIEIQNVSQKIETLSLLKGKMKIQLV